MLLQLLLLLLESWLVRDNQWNLELEEREKHSFFARAH